MGGGCGSGSGGGAPQGGGKENFAVTCCQGTPSGAAHARPLPTVITGKSWDHVTSRVLSLGPGGQGAGPLHLHHPHYHAETSGHSGSAEHRPTFFPLSPHGAPWAGHPLPFWWWEQRLSGRKRLHPKAARGSLLPAGQRPGASVGRPQPSHVTLAHCRAGLPCHLPHTLQVKVSEASSVRCPGTHCSDPCDSGHISPPPTSQHRLRSVKIRPPEPASPLLGTSSLPALVQGAPSHSCMGQPG